MSVQQYQEKVESLSVELTRVRSDYQRALASNASLTRQASVSADCVVERLEEIDELRIQLAASKMRQDMLQSEIAELRAKRSNGVELKAVAT
jgi:predicted RNase H-like nuclease (RuvC/YqgF family)